MLRFQTISADCRALLFHLMKIPALADFRLVGGTALALQKGHRASEDLDFFAGSAFKNEDILMTLQSELYPNRPENIRTYPFGLLCDINHIKTDFMYWGHSFLEPPLIEEDIRMATPLELLLMKLHAVSSRKTRKDFIDIAILLDEFPLSLVLPLFDKKYSDPETGLLLKQLTYFEEAEISPMPELFITLTWEEIKIKIQDAVKAYWEAGLES